MHTCLDLPLAFVKAFEGSTVGRAPFAAMGKKDSLHQVLAKGKALHKAMKDGKQCTVDDVPEGRKVAMNARLPGGLTLKGLMDRDSLSYAEAVSVYHAYKDYAAEELEKVSNGTKKRPVATPARATANEETKESKKKKKQEALAAEEAADKPKKSKKKNQPEEEPEDSKPSSSGRAKKGAQKPKKGSVKNDHDEEDLAEEEEEEEEEEECPEPAPKSKAKPRAKASSSSKAKPCSARRELTYATAFSSDEEPEHTEQDDAAPAGSPKRARRVVSKRALTNSEERVLKKPRTELEPEPSQADPDEGEAKAEETKCEASPCEKKLTWKEPLENSISSLRRQNASEEIATPSTRSPALKRGWRLGQILLF